MTIEFFNAELQEGGMCWTDNISFKMVATFQAEYLPRMLHSHKLAVGSEAVVGLVAQAGGVHVDVGAL